MGIQRSCKYKRYIIEYLKKKKAKLKYKLEHVEDLDDEEKLKRCIESISKDIDLKTQEEQRDFKAGCKRAKELNKFAFKQGEALAESVRKAGALPDDIRAVLKEHGFCDRYGNRMLQIMVKRLAVTGKSAVIRPNDKRTSKNHKTVKMSGT